MLEITKIHFIIIISKQEIYNITYLFDSKYFYNY